MARQYQPVTNIVSRFPRLYEAGDAHAVKYPLAVQACDIIKEFCNVRAHAEKLADFNAKANGKLPFDYGQIGSTVHSQDDLKLHRQALEAQSEAYQTVLYQLLERHYRPALEPVNQQTSALKQEHVLTYST